MQPFTDVFGKPLAIGDEITMAFPNGRSSASLRFGKITNILEKDTEVWNRDLRAYFPGPTEYTLVIEWDATKSPSWVPEKPTKIKETFGRILKLN